MVNSCTSHKQLVYFVIKSDRPRSGLDINAFLHRLSNIKFLMAWKLFRSVCLFIFAELSIFPFFSWMTVIYKSRIGFRKILCLYLYHVCLLLQIHIKYVFIWIKNMLLFFSYFVTFFCDIYLFGVKLVIIMLIIKKNVNNVLLPTYFTSAYNNIRIQKAKIKSTPQAKISRNCKVRTQRVRSFSCKSLARLTAAFCNTNVCRVNCRNKWGTLFAYLLIKIRRDTTNDSPLMCMYMEKNIWITYDVWLTLN